jgi:hypothetical protein
MPTTSITSLTPTLRDVWLYTWRIRPTRFDNMERDMLIKIEVVSKKVYNKELRKQAMESLPDERLEIRSFSYPQYMPYLKYKSKNAIKQRTIKHQYDTTFVLQKNPVTQEFDWNSSCKWRVGSYKKWDSHPAQTKIKSVYRETSTRIRDRLTRKFAKDKKQLSIAYQKELEVIRKRGKYVSVGDYNSQELGLNGDFYFRVMALLAQYDGLFGPLTNKEKSDDPRDEDLLYPIFGKHELRIIMELIKRGYIKGRPVA